MDVRTGNKLFGLIVELLYLAVRLARLARQWIKELGIIVMRAILVRYNLLKLLVTS